jgi:hypothetical protein
MLEFEDPVVQAAVQGGAAPLIVGLVVAFALSRTRYAWLAIGAGYATMAALSMGFAFSPLTVARKTVLLGLIAPLLGLAIDAGARPSRALATALAVVAGLSSGWVFLTVLQQREGAGAWTAGAGIAVFVAVLVVATLRLRDDGLRCGAAGLGLGLATGIAGLLSASTGYMLAGVSIAASAGALLLVQVILSRNIAAGFTGALPIGVLTALFGAGAVLLAKLPWYALPLLILVPAAAMLPVKAGAPVIVRAAILVFYALIAAAAPILAAWFAPRA